MMHNILASYCLRLIENFCIGQYWPFHCQDSGNYCRHLSIITNLILLNVIFSKYPFLTLYIIIVMPKFTCNIKITYFRCCIYLGDLLATVFTLKILPFPRSAENVKACRRNFCETCKNRYSNLISCECNMLNWQFSINLYKSVRFYKHAWTTPQSHH